MYKKIFRIIDGKKVEFNRTNPDYNELSAKIFHFLEGDLKSREKEVDWIEATKNKNLIAYFTDGTKHTYL